MIARSAEDRAAAAAWIARELPRLAPAWLAGQRWFGGKARRVASVGVDDVVWLEGAFAALVLLEVRYADAGPGTPAADRYAIVAAVRGSDAAGSIIGRLPERAWTIVDAPGDPRALGALLAGLTGGAGARGTQGGRLACADATDRTRRLLAGGTPAVEALNAEQSNTSVRVGGSHVFKLFRRLQDGRHPQIEIPRHLAAQGFAATPPLDGSIVYEREGGVSRAIGTLEGWVENTGDGWRHVLRQLKAAVPGSPAAAALAADLAALGAVTADFHAALAADTPVAAFAPQPVVEADWRRWRDDLERQAARTFALLEARAGEWPGRRAALVRSVLAARPRLADAFPPDAAAGAGPFHRIRIHGDYHLGQVLKTAGGFAVIDFEGEPSKPIAEREQPHCALKDVAGMLRSFDYAAAAAAPSGVERGATTAWMRPAFLDAYLERVGTGRGWFLPAAPATEALLELFELEKALYEVEYEVNNRPDWVDIPLSAVARLLRVG